MSTADWVVIGVVAVSALYGIATGFLRGAFSLAGFALGAYLGARLAPLILTDGSPYVPVVALAGAVLLGTIMRGLAGMLAAALRSSLGLIPGMRLLDRVAGLALGLVGRRLPLLGDRCGAALPPRGDRPPPVRAAFGDPL